MSRHITPRLVFFTSLLVLILVLVYNHFRGAAYEADRRVPIASADSTRPDVRVIYSGAGQYQARLTGYGAAEPRFSLTLSAVVSGRVVGIEPGLESGRLVKQDDLLLQLEDSEYRAALADAQDTLASARVDYLEEQRQGLQALAEWQASGLEGEPDSELVLRKPQLAAAQAAVRNAEAAVASAREDLEQTRIRAPFDALVTSRTVSPGSYLQSGGDIATLLSSDRLEVTVALSAADWANLPPMEELTSGQWPVTLRNVENNQQWAGRVIRAQQHLDETTRQRALIIAVDQPLTQTPPLLPGTFVQADIPGREVDNLWKLPSSALSQRGYIWYVTPENTLASVAVKPAFADAEGIYVPVPQGLEDQPRAVLTHPLSSYLDGLAVNPVEDASDE